MGGWGTSAYGIASCARPPGASRRRVRLVRCYSGVRCTPRPVVFTRSLACCADCSGNSVGGVWVDDDNAVWGMQRHTRRVCKVVDCNDSGVVGFTVGLRNAPLRPRVWGCFVRLCCWSHGRVFFDKSACVRQHAADGVGSLGESVEAQVVWVECAAQYVACFQARLRARALRSASSHGWDVPFLVRTFSAGSVPAARRQPRRRRQGVLQQCRR